MRTAKQIICRIDATYAEPFRNVRKFSGIYDYTEYYENNHIVISLNQTMTAYIIHIAIEPFIREELMIKYQITPRNKIELNKSAT